MGPWGGHVPSLDLMYLTCKMSLDTMTTLVFLYPYIYIYIPMWRFIIGVGSHDFGGPEVPQSAICKLESQEVLWYIIQFKSKVLRTWSFKVEGQERMMSQLKKREREFTLPSSVLFRLGSQKNWMVPTHIGQGWSLLSLLNQMLISFKNTPRNNVFI